MSVSLSKFKKAKEDIQNQPFAKKNYTTKKGVSFNYLMYRLKRPFLKLRYNNYQKANAHEPWLCPDAIKALNTLLDGATRGLEYGSGRSTTFFAPYFTQYISIEHHEAWYKQVKEQLTELPQVEYHLIEPEGDAPQQHLSSEQQYFFTEDEYPVKDTVFKKYSEFVLNFDDDYFDFILIDGRARKSCALNSFSKLKPGGLLVLDNSERVRYHKVHDCLKDWHSIETTTGLTNTTIWRKP